MSSSGVMVPWKANQLSGSASGQRMKPRAPALRRLASVPRISSIIAVPTTIKEGRPWSRWLASAPEARACSLAPRSARAPRSAAARSRWSMSGVTDDPV